MLLKTDPALTRLILLLSLVLLAGTACGQPAPGQTAVLSPSPETIQASSSPTPTPFPPSPTPIPLAAEVNESIITLADYQAELARYQAAVERELTEEDKQRVLDNLIDLTLLAQAARAAGFELDEETLTARIDALDSEQQPLEEWLASQGYTRKTFRESYRRSLEAAWMRDRIIQDVPEQAEQVHVMQMLFYTSGQAYSALNELQNGIEFAQLAAARDPQTNGDLGWIPRGVLALPALEEVIFDLEPGEISGVIETEIGFHIIKVLKTDSNRPLNPEYLRILQEKTLTEWLDRRRKLSTINTTLP